MGIITIKIGNKIIVPRNGNFIKFGERKLISDGLVEKYETPGFWIVPGKSWQECLRCETYII